MSRAEHCVVALVASAGGLEAVTTVLSDLDADFPGSVVVLIHIDPTRTSALAEILRRSSRLPVTTATDGEPLVPGRVYVAPPGLHTLVTPDHRLSLVLSGAYPPSRPSADLLQTTMALTAGARAIAVVMTGGGHDGATGATAVHKHGGSVLATDEASSHSYAMPAATIGRDHINPEVVPVERVAEALLRLAVGLRSSE